MTDTVKKNTAAGHIQLGAREIIEALPEHMHRRENFTLIYKEETGSTNADAMQLLHDGVMPDGGALPLILEKWISGIQASVRLQSDAEGDEFDRLVEKHIYAVAGSLEGMVNGFEFAKAIVTYWRAYCHDDASMKSNVLKWFRGEYTSRKEAKADLDINFIVTDETWYDFLKIFAVFLVSAGYKGMLVIIDELVNIFKFQIPSPVRTIMKKSLPCTMMYCRGKQSISAFYWAELPNASKTNIKASSATRRCVRDSQKAILPLRI